MANDKANISKEYKFFMPDNAVLEELQNNELIFQLRESHSENINKFNVITEEIQNDIRRSTIYGDLSERDTLILENLNINDTIKPNPVINSPAQKVIR